MARLAGEPWIMCPGTALGRLVRSMCIAAGFQPRVAATVHDVGTAISLVGIGWGITIAPLLTPAATPAPVVRLPIDGVDTNRYSVLIVRDGEHLSPRMAATISAVRSVSAELRASVRDAAARLTEARSGGLAGLGGSRRACLRRDSGRRPAADDVAHRQQPDNLVPLHHDEVPEAAPHHGSGGGLHGPAAGREDDVLRAVIAGDLDVRALVGGNRHQEVAFRKDADSGVVRIHHDGSADVAGGHHPGRRTQRVGRSDSEDLQGHSVFDLQGVSPPGQGRA
jgi:hypothetical protein